TVFFFSSFSSCSLDFFFAFLSLASPRPVGILVPPVRMEAFRTPTSIAFVTRMLSPVPARKGASSRGTTRSARVTTRTGDGGDTSLFGKGRVRKTDPRIVALGDLDEAQTVARRAERGALVCVDAGAVSGEVLLPWLNRLSDLLFVLARATEGTSRPRRALKGSGRRPAR